MKSEKVLRLTQAAMFTAMTCVATMVIQVPSPMNGFVNLGDCMVLLSGFLLGPFYGVAAAGLGSMLADVISGYAHYAPGTLVIKALCALIAWFIYDKFGRRGFAAVLGGVAAECFMVFGYFCYACLLLGRGFGAAASIPGNVVQGIFGVIAGVLLLKVVEKSISVISGKTA